MKNEPELDLLGLMYIVIFVAVFIGVAYVAFFGFP
jgi:hypothetical protein